MRTLKKIDKKLLNGFFCDLVQQLNFIHCIKHVQISEEFGAYEYEQQIPSHRSLPKVLFLILKPNVLYFSTSFMDLKD